MTSRRRPVYVTPGRHPFEVGPLIACAIVGTVLALTDVRPPSMARGLPEPLLTVWLALVALGGVAGLIGVYWRGSVDDGLLIEFGGVCAIAAACTLYVLALFAGNPPAVAFGSAGLLAGLAGGAIGRSVQCFADWRRVRRGRVQQVRVDLPLLVDPGPEPDEHGEGGVRM